METLIVERKDGVVTVTMNRPERKNAANNKMLNELKQVFGEVEDSDDDRVMVLTGAGGAFCSGADLSDPDGPATDRTRSGLARMRRLGDVALGLHRVELRATTDNTRSRSVAERLGFAEEGVLREAAAFAGGPRDVVVDGLLVHDWRATTCQPRTA